MKKYLSIICVLLTLTAFASCGGSISSSIVGTPEVSESVVLDSVFENDYLKISVSSDWEESTETLGKTDYIDWSWESENSSGHNISLDITEDYSGKVSLEDFMSAYNDEKHITGMYLFDFEKDKLIDSFETNNQAYVVTGNAGHTGHHSIFFKTNKISGKFFYSSDDEEIVMDMINSIEFKPLVKQTETKPRKTTKKVSETTTKYTTSPPTERIPETQSPVVTPVQTALHFILNLETNCIHIDSGCSAALKILPENYSTVDIKEDDLSSYNGTYWACGKCCPSNYRQLLPKF
ncbi:MAG: hypothetical protein K2J39_11890 [Ruminococcus sp.]|nr:hypothetical protein [Ruminococcus sp.]